ncbi:hypothetical protein PENSPDRAFT_642315 [Peniophora sp. CONT]|nr:hypothetical protein PENSPDRAFT_642315 [Peniophora sp. CONT]
MWHLHLFLRPPSSPLNMEFLSPITNKYIKAQSVEEVLWQYTGIADAESAAAKGEMPTPERLERAPRSPLHALVIGIDHFKSERINNLRGCVADADAIDDYLRTDLHVPSGQIVNLRNEQATRVAILRELNALRTWSSIRKDDPILIFFAGHGSRADTPIGWSAGSEKISLIVPHDCLVEENGQTIQPIPDRTIGALLHALAESNDGDLTGKGDNITVILDCCHSGSGTRVSEFTAERLERGFVMEEPIPASLDEDLWSGVPDERAIAVAAGFAKAGSRSHVLLAACREIQVAHEENGRGAFTRALLNTLRGVATDKVTYQDVMERLPDISDQTPQCEGRNVDRILFNALSPSKERVIYPIVHQEGKLILKAGSIHGVTMSAKFSIYASRDFTTSDTPLALVEATAINPFKSELTLLPAQDDDVPMLPTDVNCYAFQTSMGKAEAIRIHIPLTNDLLPAMMALARELEMQQTSSQAILLSDEKSADIGIRVREDGTIEFVILDPLITAYGIRSLYPAVKPDARFIHPILRGASHFFWHLRRSPEKNMLRNKVDVEVSELVEDIDAELDEYLCSPLKRTGDNLFRGGAVDVVADSKRTYGVAIQNKTAVPMHVWAFYFDCSDLSIFEYYRPAAVGPDAEPMLPAHGTLSIGWGAAGGRPFTYFLRDRQDQDVGFIKLFISTEFVDLSSIPQRSPFMTDRAAGPRGPSPPAIWDTVTIAVVQRKAGLRLPAPSA